MKTANERLVEVRIALGFQKKAEFAEKVSIERSTYDKMEKGPHKPSADNLEKIAARFSEVNLNWLLLGQGPMLFLEGNEPAAQLPAPLPPVVREGFPVTPGTASPQEADFVGRLIERLERELAEARDREAWYQEMLKKPLASSNAAGYLMVEPATPISMRPTACQPVECRVVAMWPRGLAQQQAA